MTLTDALFDLVIGPIIMKRRSMRNHTVEHLSTKVTVIPTVHFKYRLPVAHKDPQEYNRG